MIVEDLRLLDAVDVPLAVARLHRLTAVGDEVELWLPAGSTGLSPTDLVEGGGFVDPRVLPGPGDGSPPTVRLRATRASRLADTIGPGMRLLVCGVNASLHAARAGVGYVGPGNRFWPALRASGAIGAPSERAPMRLLLDDAIGMTDLVKRPTPRATEVSVDEQRAGLARVERVCTLLEPEAVLIAGLSGWRAAVDRRARPGWQERHLGPSPVYVMPSTSGLNAATPLAALVDHVRAALVGPPERAG